MPRELGGGGGSVVRAGIAIKLNNGVGRAGGTPHSPPQPAAGEKSLALRIGSGVCLGLHPCESAVYTAQLKSADVPIQPDRIQSNSVPEPEVPTREVASRPGICAPGGAGEAERDMQPLLRRSASGAGLRGEKPASGLPKHVQNFTAPLHWVTREGVPPEQIRNQSTEATVASDPIWDAVAGGALPSAEAHGDRAMV